MYKRQLKGKAHPVVSVTPDGTLAEAIALMNEANISQVPVLEDGKVVGSLSETGILNRLIADPSSREQSVREVMGEPFPIVPRSLHVEHLAGYLESGPGAILVHDDDGYRIVTKSDLILALARMERAATPVS